VCVPDKHHGELLAGEAASRPRGSPKLTHGRRGEVAAPTPAFVPILDHSYLIIPRHLRLAINPYSRPLDRFNDLRRASFCPIPGRPRRRRAQGGTKPGGRASGARGRRRAARTRRAARPSARLSGGRVAAPQGARRFGAVLHGLRRQSAGSAAPPLRHGGRPEVCATDASTRARVDALSSAYPGALRGALRRGEVFPLMRCFPSSRSGHLSS
jgi:hypothetical protein